MSNQTPLSLEEIKSRSVLGVLTLTSRTFVLQVIALISTFILTIILDPATFGIFFVVTAAVNFLNYFSDVGLAAALIQKQDEPSQTDLRTTFTIQQLLVGLSVVLALLLSPYVGKIYKFGDGGIFLFRSLVIAFFLSSLKTIPSVILERKLNFQKLVIPQIMETVAFYIVAIFLAIRGLGVVSFAWAAIIRGLVGTSILYLIAPWQIGLGFDLKSAKRLLSFGIPYQANSFLALVKDDLLTAFLGIVLPFTQVGYIGWAKKWSEVALRLIMDNIIKVTFPTFSRLQHDPVLLSKAIQKSLLFLILLTLPIALGMVFLIRPFINIVPKYIKWEPALLSFYLFTFSAMLAALSSPLVNALNALGKVKQTFILMLLWTALTWIFIPIGIKSFGFQGVAMAAVLISLTSFIPLVFIKSYLRFDMWKEFLKPLFATLVMSIVMAIFYLVSPNPQIRFISVLVSGVVVYSLLIKSLLGETLRPYIDYLRL